MTLQPFYIVSLLIEQPTWGGDYIAEFKNLSEPAVNQTKIGQSYELAEDSVLLQDKTEQRPFLFATATQINQPQWYGPKAKTINIQDLIKQDPAAVLGKKVVQKAGPEMKLLNKFTQAKQNSFQVHVRVGQEFKHWQPKPESWYFFEPGKATLGLKPQVDLKYYQQRCEKINQHALELSEQVQAGQLKIATAREKLAEFIDQDHPLNYVNTVQPPKDGVVDLSTGGIHHSWEDDPKSELGNIVYEVQLDQRDEVSSIRAFDQGKMKNDGQIRQIAIDDYFRALNANQEDNQPEQYMQATQLTQEAGAKILKIFDNQHYQLTQLEFRRQYSGQETQLQDQFHHLFVKQGQLKLIHHQEEWPLNQGESIFIPAGCEHYQLTATKTTQVLKTTA